MSNESFLASLMIFVGSAFCVIGGGMFLQGVAHPLFCGAIAAGGMTFALFNAAQYVTRAPGSADANTRAMDE